MKKSYEIYTAISTNPNVGLKLQAIEQFDASLTPDQVLQSLYNSFRFEGHKLVVQEVK